MCQRLAPVAQPVRLATAGLCLAPGRWKPATRGLLLLQKKLRDELADTNGLLDNTKRKLAMVSQSAALPAASAPQPSLAQAAPAEQGDAEDLQRLAQRRGEELEAERAQSIMLHRYLLRSVRPAVSAGSVWPPAGLHAWQGLYTALQGCRAEGRLASPSQAAHPPC